MSLRTAFMATLFRAAAGVAAALRGTTLLRWRAETIPHDKTGQNTATGDNIVLAWENTGVLTDPGYTLTKRDGEGTTNIFPTAGPGAVATVWQIGGLDRLFTALPVPITGATPRTIACLIELTTNDINHDLFGWGDYHSTDASCGLSISGNGPGLIANLYNDRILICHKPPTGKWLAVVVTMRPVGAAFRIEWLIAGQTGMLAAGYSDQAQLANVDTGSSVLCEGNGYWAGRGYQFGLADLQLDNKAPIGSAREAIFAEWKTFTGIDYLQALSADYHTYGISRYLNCNMVGYIRVPPLPGIRAVRIWFRSAPGSEQHVQRAGFLMDLDTTNNSLSVTRDAQYGEFSGIESNFTGCFVDGQPYAVPNPFRHDPGRLAFTPMDDDHWHSLVVNTPYGLFDETFLGERYGYGESSVYYLNHFLGAVEYYDHPLTLAEARNTGPNPGLLAQYRARVVGTQLMDESGNGRHATFYGQVPASFIA